MKRTVMSLPLAALLATSLTGAAAAQADESGAPTDTGTTTVVVTFDQPVLAGFSADLAANDGASVTIQDDSTLVIELPAGTDLTDLAVNVSSDGGQGVAKVSANDASFDELVAALDSVGVSPSDRWAREIMEYRPYDVDDPTLAHLQDELAKYDPAPETLAHILSVLEP